MHFTAEAQRGDVRVWLGLGLLRFFGELNESCVLEWVCAWWRERMDEVLCYVVMLEEDWFGRRGRRGGVGGVWCGHGSGEGAIAADVGRADVYGSAEGRASGERDRAVRPKIRYRISACGWAGVLLCENEQPALVTA